MQQPQNNFDPAQSLSLIRAMIETTKYSIRDNSHFFLLWGWATLIGCVTQFILMVVFKSPQHYLAWLVTPVALVVHVAFYMKDKRDCRVKTFISEATGYLWASIGFAFLAFFFIFSKIGWQYCFPFYILLYGVGTSVSGSLLQFKPMVIGGRACFVLAILAAYLPYDMQILLTAAAILISYIIPGHLLRLKYKRENPAAAQLAGA